MKPGFQTLPGDRASYNPVYRVYPPGFEPPPLPGMEVMPEIFQILGHLPEDPDRLKLSHSGAKREILALARNHLEESRVKPSKGEWKKIGGRLKRLLDAASTLQAEIGPFDGLLALLLRRTDFHLPTEDFLAQLAQFQADVARALESVPKNHLGDAVTALIRQATPNELLVLGCQNILCACGKKTGCKVGGPLQRLAKAVKRLALGTGVKAGGIPAAMRSELVKGRSKGQNLKIEALDLIRSDLKARKKNNTELYRQAEEEYLRLNQPEVP